MRSPVATISISAQPGLVMLCLCRAAFFRGDLGGLE